MQEQRSVRTKRTFARYALAALLALGIGLPAPADAHTSAEVEEKCPLDGTIFTTTEDMSGTSFGKRLDLKAIGPTASPWSIPVCPKDHFVLFKKKFSKEEIADLRSFVGSKPYQAVAADHSSYFLLARIFEHLKKPPGNIGFIYLQASWQVETDPAAYREYAQSSLASYREAILAAKEHDEAWQTAQLISGELERRLGLLPEATKRFTELAKQPEFQKGIFKSIVSYQLELLKQNDTAPHKIPQPEP